MSATDGLSTEYRWEIEQGKLDIRRFPVLDQNDELFDIPGWSVDAKIRGRPGGSTLYTWPTEGWVVSGPYVDITTLPSVSLAWTFRIAWFRIKVIHSSDPTQVLRIVRGPLIVYPD